MIKLSISNEANITVRPRWPARYVFVSDAALAALQKARILLRPEIDLVLTRGYEKEGFFLGCLHKLARQMGAVLFRLSFPERVAEAPHIFCANGHDHGGNNLDLAIQHRGALLKLLKSGVFTTAADRKAAYRVHQPVIEKVWTALRSCGFTVHPNATEALQIHCEYQTHHEPKA